MHIMVIDDEVSWLKMVGVLLEMLDYEVTLVSSASEGVELMKAEPHKYQLLLLDLMMPEMNGNEVLTVMKKMPELAHIPVLLQTGCHDMVQINTALALGAMDYITKPFKRNELGAMLKKIAV
jgi:CheY-like chemotaxis protein